MIWAQICVNWEQEIWNRIIWSDKAIFKLGGGKVYITRRPKEKYLLNCYMPKFKDFTIVMVWAYIGGNSLKGPLFIWDRDNLGNINSRSYTQFIYPQIQQFKIEYKIFRVGIGNAILMQDGAPLHRANATKSFFHQQAIRLLWWLVNSPDLNPIKNVWRLLKY